MALREQREYPQSWYYKGNSIKRGELAIENVPSDEGRLVKFPTQIPEEETGRSWKYRPS